MNQKQLTLFFILLGSMISFGLIAQNAGVWNNKQCAVVLTYDDAINIDLDTVVPALDSLNLKGTFYLIGASPVTDQRMNEWRLAAQHGHELGNHSLFHPCDGNRPGRGFITPDTDLSKYTVSRAVKEIRSNNTLLKSIDGKVTRTFAYPCGDLKIGDVYFYNELKNDFAGARGVRGVMPAIDSVNLDNIDSFVINGQSADYMISLVNQSMKTSSLLVFTFHGVGGGHSINVDAQAHSKLLHYLKLHENEIWVATMVDVASHVKEHNKVKKN